MLEQSFGSGHFFRPNLGCFLPGPSQGLGAVEGSFVRLEAPSPEAGPNTRSCRRFVVRIDTHRSNLPILCPQDIVSFSGVFSAGDHGTMPGICFCTSP
jgi:hypothetical protein